MRFGRILVVSAGAVMLAAGVFAQEAFDTEAMQQQLKKELSMNSIVKSDFRDAKDQKNERVKLITEQEKDSPFVGTLRFTVELTDKADEVRYGQILKAQAKHPAGYAGKDEWTFEIPHGDLDKPRMTAYALEYGFETNKVFTPVEQEFYKTESAEEIMARSKDPKKMLKITAKTKTFKEDSAGE